MKVHAISSLVLLSVNALLFTSSAAANPLSLTLNWDQSDSEISLVDQYKRGEGSIMDVLRNDGRFNKVVQVLEENSDFRDDLEQGDKITFLAPTDEAWKYVDEVLENMRKTRRGGEHRREMEDVLRYHVLKDEFSYKDMFDGQLLCTALKEPKLEDSHQKIRVHKFLGQYYLNMCARVHREDLRADNGNILIIDKVLCPPPEATTMMENIPFSFSTTLVAAQKTDLLQTIEEEKGVTVFAPVNFAWESLGIRNLIYLFSPRGHDDLKKIMKYHIAEDIVYSCDMMKENKLHLRTLLQDQEIEINTSKCTKRGDRESDRDREDRRHRKSRDENRERKPSEYIFSLNKGEARIQQTCTDVLAENGVIQPINAVLIPKDVWLPHAMGN